MQLCYWLGVHLFFLYAFVFLDTVDENILDLAAKHGRSLYTKDHAVGTVKVTPFEMDKKVSGDSQIKTNKKQKGQKGDFILRWVCGSILFAPFFTPHINQSDRQYAGTDPIFWMCRTDDMLAILFPHLFEDIEFLVPWEYSNSQINLHTSAAGSQPTAGPSRLGWHYGVGYS